jgi:hypothetical protein
MAQPLAERPSEIFIAVRPKAIHTAEHRQPDGLLWVTSRSCERAVVTSGEHRIAADFDTYASLGGPWPPMLTLQRLISADMVRSGGAQQPVNASV